MYTKLNIGTIGQGWSGKPYAVFMHGKSRCISDI